MASGNLIEIMHVTGRLKIGDIKSLKSILTKTNKDLVKPYNVKKLKEYSPDKLGHYATNNKDFYTLTVFMVVKASTPAEIKQDIRYIYTNGKITLDLKTGEIKGTIYPANEAVQVLDEYPNSWTTMTEYLSKLPKSKTGKTYGARTLYSHAYGQEVECYGDWSPKTKFSSK